MIKAKFSSSGLKLFVLFSSFMLVTAISSIFGQEYNTDPHAMQQVQEMAIQLQQMYDQLPPEQQEMAIPLLQKSMQKALMGSSLEQQEFLIQKLNQMLPPEFVEKLLPPGYK